MDIRILTPDDYLLIMELAPDDEIMTSMFLSVAAAIKAGFDGISYTYGAFYRWNDSRVYIRLCLTQ